MSIKEIFELIKKYFSLVWDKKLWVVLCSLVVGMILGVRAKLQPDIYKSDLTFMVNEDEVGMSGIGAVLGEFGFGGEVGISTNTIPPRGPVGLNQLVSYKYQVSSNGKIRK